MAGKKEKERFLFFKYVPQKKTAKAVKNEEYKEIGEAECFEPPVNYPDSSCDMPCPEEPVCPEEPDYGESPVFPGYPEYPEIPECPEAPEYPDIPECPEYPEYPEVPEVPECPELPEIPEPPEIPELPEEEEPTVEGPCPENAIMHVVQAGDTFWKLSKTYGTTVEAIAAANPNIDPLNLQIGETLCIPMGIPGAKG